MTTSEQRERIDAVYRECFADPRFPSDHMNAACVLVVQLRAQLAAAEETADYKAMYLDLWDSAQKHYVEREELRTRAERAESETAYIRRAFRGAVESDKLAITYQTIGSYRAGLLKTLNALDPRDGQGA